MDNVNFLKIKTDQNKLYFQDLEKVLALTEIQYFNPIYENFDKYIHKLFWTALLSKINL